MKNDVIIVGSGLGGLLCAYALGKEGYKVCVLEKNHQIGGCMQTFTRKGKIFDTGMHYIGSMDDGQILNSLFKFFGLTGKLKLKKLDKNGFDVFGIAGIEYKYAQGFDNFIDTIHQKFPKEKQALLKYVDKLKEIRQASPIHNLKDDDSYNNIAQYINIKAFDFIKSLTSDIKLQNVLAALNPAYAGMPDKTPLYTHSVINNSFIESAWRFVDGGDQIAKILEENIKSQGGTILKNCEVEKFVFENNSLTSVALTNSERFFAKNFISNLHPAVTLSKIESKHLSNAYRKRIGGNENTISVFSVYMVLKKKSFKYINYNYYHNENENVWGASIYNPEKFPEGYMLYTPASSKSDEYAESLVVYSYMKYDEVRKWQDTTVEKRGEEYLEFKQKKAEKLINLVEKRWPGLKNKIDSYYTSTPLTYRDYTATCEGSIYGILRDANNPLQSYISPRTKIPNLFLTGQNISMHGVLGVTIGAILTIAEFLGLGNILKKIKNA